MDRRKLLNIISLLLGIFIFLGLLYILGPQEIVNALKKTNLTFLALALIAFSISQGLRIAKWRIMAEKANTNMDLSTIVKFFFAVKFVGGITPGRIGELLPPLLTRRRHSFGKMSSIVIFDRVLESLTTISMGVIFFSIIFSQYFTEDYLFLFIVLLFLVLVVFLLVSYKKLMFKILNKMKMFFEKHPNRFTMYLLSYEERIVHELENFYDSIHQFFSPKAILSVSMLTLIAWISDVLVAKILLNSLNEWPSFVVVAGAWALGSLSCAIAPIPGGLGLGDVPPLYFLYVFGISKSGLGGFLVIGKILTYIIPTVVGYLTLTQLLRPQK